MFFVVAGLIGDCFVVVLWVMAIISASYSVVVLLEDALGKMYPTVDSTVAYGSGFYLIAGTGLYFCFNDVASVFVDIFLGEMHITVGSPL